jgi:RNA polymerase sigma-70 factor, ECF subfamily
MTKITFNRVNNLEILYTSEIWNKFRDDLYYFILRRVSVQDDAQDILQSVFEKIHKHSGKLAEIENIGGWVYAITRNEIVSYYRSQKNHEPLPESLAQPEMETNTEKAEFFSKCMNVFIKDFSSEEQLILGSISTGKSVKKIAEELDKPYSTVKSKSLRSKEKINRKFIECCGTMNEDSDYYCGCG